MHTEENTKIVIRDFDLKIRKKFLKKLRDFKPVICQEILHQISNDNGIRFRFPISKGMLIITTFFPHSNIHKQK